MDELMNTLFEHYQQHWSPIE